MEDRIGYRLPLLLATLFMAFFVAACGASESRDQFERMTREMEQRIAAGSSRADVIALLNERKIEYSETISTDLPPQPETSDPIMTSGAVVRIQFFIKEGASDRVRAGRRYLVDMDSNGRVVEVIKIEANTGT